MIPDTNWIGNQLRAGVQERQLPGAHSDPPSARYWPDFAHTLPEQRPLEPLATIDRYSAPAMRRPRIFR
jgi:hypothetical protein